LQLQDDCNEKPKYAKHNLNQVATTQRLKWVSWKSRPAQNYGPHQYSFELSCKNVD